MRSKIRVIEVIMATIAMLGCFIVGKIFGFVTTTKLLENTGKKVFNIFTYFLCKRSCKGYIRGLSSVFDIITRHRCGHLWNPLKGRKY